MTLFPLSLSSLRLTEDFWSVRSSAYPHQGSLHGCLPGSSSGSCTLPCPGTQGLSGAHWTSRKDSKLLFVSLQEGHAGEIHPNTITGWVRKLIRFCYDQVDDRSAQLLGTSVHAIRGIAATLAFKGSAPLEEIMQACSWKGHNTFTSFYLKDVSGMSKDVYSLGPLVVAQHLVSGK